MMSFVRFSNLNDRNRQVGYLVLLSNTHSHTRTKICSTDQNDSSEKFRYKTLKYTKGAAVINQ